MTDQPPEDERDTEPAVEPADEPDPAEPGWSPRGRDWSPCEDRADGATDDTPHDEDDQEVTGDAVAD